MKRRASVRRVTRYRSSVTGRFVKAGYAKRHPRTTERERIRVR